MSGALVLAIDASTYTGSVAVLQGSRILVTREAAMRGEREERLMPAAAQALAAAGVPGPSLDAIVCGAGPGSFTSLRIAGSIAKGLALGWGKPLLAVPSLLLLVASAPDTAAPGRYLAVMDALRGEVFAAEHIVHPDGPISAVGDWRRLRRESLPRAFSPGARVIGPESDPPAVPLARGVARLADWMARAEPVMLATWEPDYGRKAEAETRWEAAHGRPLPRA